MGEHRNEHRDGRRGIGSRLRRPLVARRIDEEDRSASPLELLFDLTFVVAISQAVIQLAHGIETGHTVESLTPFLLTFFAIWWAWMNFTWFSSGYDNDDVLYRVTTMVQMCGVLVLSAGIPDAFEKGDYAPVTFGYLIMRVGLIIQWVRAARADPVHRRSSLRTAAGYAVLQLGWLLRLLLPEGGGAGVAVVLVILELVVPLWALRAGDPSWNPGHIAERFGLFTIILLGESVLAAMTGFQRALEGDGLSLPLVVIAVAAVVMLFALWWLYYLAPFARGLAQRRRFSFVWGYGHALLFAGLAALAAGFEVAVASPAGAEIPDALIVSTVTVPVSVFLLALWALSRLLLPQTPLRGRMLCTAAVLVALLPAAVGALQVAGVVAAAAAVCAATVVLVARDQG